MGRPRKRQKVAGGSRDDLLLTAEDFPSEPVYSACQMLDDILDPDSVLGAMNPYVPQLSASARTEEPVCGQLGSLSNSINGVDSDFTPLSNSPSTPPLSAMVESYPSNLSWTDYLDLANLPSPVPESPRREAPPSNQLAATTSSQAQSDHHHSTNHSTQPQITLLPAAPSCTCLADLYLSLSALSTLPSLPVNAHTVETLQAATRTAHAVLYCRTCPQKFQSGMQNVMLLGTILPVIADGWSRILRTPAPDLARGFDTDPSTALLSVADLSASWTRAKENEWKLFAHYLVRQYVFGDAPPPGIHLPGVCFKLSQPTSNLYCPSPSPSYSVFQSHSSKPPIIILNNLCDALERRQKSWHGLIEATGEFPRPRGESAVVLARKGGGSCGEEQKRKAMMGLQNGVGSGNGEGNGNGKEKEKKEHLCLKIVESVRSVLALVDKRPDLGQEAVGAD